MHPIQLTSLHATAADEPFGGSDGGLIGIHFKRERGLPVPIVSIDGISLKEFDFVDIGELLPTASAAPVVIKSLVFPTSSGVGQTAFEPATDTATEAASG